MLATASRSAGQEQGTICDFQRILWVLQKLVWDLFCLLCNWLVWVSASLSATAAAAATEPAESLGCSGPSWPTARCSRSGGFKNILQMRWLPFLWKPVKGGNQKSFRMRWTGETSVYIWGQEGWLPLILPLVFIWVLRLLLVGGEKNYKNIHIHKTHSYMIKLFFSLFMEMSGNEPL